MLRNLYSLFLCLLITAGAVAQSTSGTLKGIVKDKTTGEVLPFATVVVLNGGTQVAAGATDFDGKFTIKPIPVGTYNVRCDFVGYNPRVVSGVVVAGGKIKYQDFLMESGVNLDEVIIVQYKKPLIEKDGGSSGGSVSREDISKMSARSATSVASTVGGVSSSGTAEGEVSVRGARSSDTFVYIDGIKVRGSANLPKAAIQEVSVITGGLPANIGDAVGGVINITTRGAQSTFFGGFDFLTSGFRSGDKNVGLDAFGRTQLEGFFAGPLVFRKDSAGTKTSPILGFFLSGNVRQFEDSRPSAIGNWYVKDDVLADIEANPSAISEVLNDDGSTSYSTSSRANLLQAGDFEHRAASRNAGRTGASVSGKIDYNVSPDVTLSVGASGDYLNTNEFLFRGYTGTNGFPGGQGRSNSLLNYKNNENRKDLSWRTYVRFTQRFKSDDSADSKAKIKNAFYTISADYSKFNRVIEDKQHGENFFGYGHVGKFDIFQTKTYEFENGAMHQSGVQDTLVVFTPSSVNPDLAGITSQYFNSIDDPNATMSLENISAAGVLRNGDVPRSIYRLWNAPGLANNLYRKRDNSQMRLVASGSADVGDHAITLGVEYEQRVDRGYDLAPVGLWTRGRQLLGGQTEVVGSVQSDVPVDGFFQYDWALAATDDPTLFNLNFRESMGLNDIEQANIDAVSPEQLSIDMFSADDLLANGSSLVSYYGFDHKGNKLTSDPSFDDYFNAVDDKGYKTKQLGAFRPIYNAFFLMDKFSFDDIIFNVGVRVDRYDANQKVLKDNYIVGDYYTVGNNPIDNLQAPSNIGDDYVVYVEDYEASTVNVVGYRDGNDWYTADGVFVSSPDLIQSSTVVPYLTPETVAADGSQFLDPQAFVDYQPVINVMPRLAFSFPISDEAVFFAHYDVLTQRPGAGQNRLNLVHYDFIETRSNSVTNNPNLRPSRTVDYELGFQQVLTKSSSLKISGFYRDMSDQLNVRFLANAWPNNYLTYENIDFGTVKGMTFAFDLRRTGNVRLLANYTLQFANSTGSNSASGQTLARNGEPNLRVINPVDYDRRHAINIVMDYRYGSGSDYNGPVWFGKKVFQNMGANLIADIGSGTPYNSRKIAGSLLDGARGLNGSINGANMPGSAQLNLQIDRDITLKFGKDDEKDKAKTSNMNVYLLVNNLLNTKIVRNVYSYTGSPSNDGYLTSGIGQQEIDGAEDSAAFTNYYNLRLENPYNYGMARTIQIGVRMDF